MITACRVLRAAHGAARAAHSRDPAPEVEADMLRAVPLNTAPSRRLPDGSEPLGALCAGVIDAATRLRHAAGVSAGYQAWLPEVSSAELRHAAAAAVPAAHNCAAILTTLAGSRPARQDDPVPFRTAAEAVARERDTWLGIVRTMDHFRSDVPGRTAPEVTAAGDLALWTGRLAYADPAWTPAGGPGRRARTAAQLAARPGDAARVTAAVHHTLDALSSLAAVHRSHARALGHADRLLVPSRTLAEGYDVAQPYSPAPPSRAALVHDAYQQACQASAEAAEALAGIASRTRAPSRILTLVRAAQAAEPAKDAERADQDVPEPLPMPGPVERKMRGLGVGYEYLNRAAALDRAAEQLMIDAVTQRAAQAAAANQGAPRRSPSPDAARHPEREPAE